MLRIGIPKEIKSGELRVAGLPQHAEQLRKMGCEVFVQSSAGAGAGFGDDHYRAAGATIVPTLADVYARAELLWKVKEILPEEFSLLRAEHVIFTYLHPCPRPPMVQAIKASNCIALAYEEVIDANGRRPLLTPMSRVAGAGAVLLAGQYAQSLHGGIGKILFAAEGVEPMTFVIIGGGAAGQEACRSALGGGCKVNLLEAKPAMVPVLREKFPQASVLAWSEPTFRDLLPRADVLINCTMWMDGDPHLLTRPMLKLMRQGSLIMDVSADPHGAIETSETTTHENPIRVVDGILHYCVQNIPSLFARSASEALTAATWPYVQLLARLGPAAAVRQASPLQHAVVAWNGKLFGRDLARIQGIPTGTVADVQSLVAGV